MLSKDENKAAAAITFYCFLGMALAVIQFAAASSSNAKFTLSILPADGLEMPVCNGTISKCQAANLDEFLMESEISRRFLQDGKRISYGALQPDRPVCSPGQGRSYGGNCLPPPTNTPSRGCNNYYDRCRTGGG